MKVDLFWIKKGDLFWIWYFISRLVSFNIHIAAALPRVLHIFLECGGKTAVAVATPLCEIRQRKIRKIIAKLRKKICSGLRK